MGLWHLVYDQAPAGLKAQSAKRRKENSERSMMADRRFPGRDAWCVVPWCGKRADDFHEPLTRARSGSITDPDNTEPVCRGHNSELTEEPAWGYALHLLIHSGDKRSYAQMAADRREAIAQWVADHMWEAS
jgi:hypothetical protein